MMKKNIFLLLFLISLTVSCTHKDKLLTKIENQMISVFDDKLEHQIAKAIKDRKIKLVEKLINDNKETLINKSYEGEYYSLLHLAVELKRVKSIEILLKAGFNPNIKSERGITPLFLATGFLRITPGASPDIDIVKLLLEYGADPEVICFEYATGKNYNITNLPLTPLMNSISNSMNYVYNFKFLFGDKKNNNRKDFNTLDVTKLLVEQGKVDIDRTTELGITAADLALFYLEIEKAYYLIVEKNADITHKFYKSDADMANDIPFERLKVLRLMVYPLDSDEYKLKLKLIETFNNHGYSYYDEPVMPEVLQIIKNKYPDDWEEYVKVY